VKSPNRGVTPTFLNISVLVKRHETKKYGRFLFIRLSFDNFIKKQMTDLINATTARTRLPEFEMVGLHHNSQGRCCTMHSHCGKHVEEGDVLRLVHVVVPLGPDEPPEDAIKLVKIVDGTEGCMVGFVPRAFARLDRVKSKIGSYCFVVEMYDISTNKYKRRLSHRNYGVASCLFLDEYPAEIPHME
jgi:hypothetical protein